MATSTKASLMLAVDRMQLTDEEKTSAMKQIAGMTDREAGDVFDKLHEDGDIRYEDELAWEPADFLSAGETHAAKTRQEDFIRSLSGGPEGPSGTWGEPEQTVTDKIVAAQLERFEKGTARMDRLTERFSSLDTAKNESTGRRGLRVAANYLQKSTRSYKGVKYASRAMKRRR